MGDVGETTDELPSIVAARRLTYVSLALVVLAGLAFAGVLTARPPQGGSAVAPATSAAIDAEVQRLAKILDVTASASRAQIETMAHSSQVRAGVMTDVATVKDLVTSEIQLPRNLNQTLELVQLRGSERTVLLRMPDGSTPIAPLAPGVLRYTLDGNQGVAIQSSTPVTPVETGSGITGELVISTPVDFTLTRDALAAHATRIAISGPGWSYVIVPGPDTGTEALHRPVPITGATATLDVAPRLTSTTASWVAPARWIAIGVALVAAVALALSFYRNRTP